MTVRIPKLALIGAGAVVVGVLAAAAFGAFGGRSSGTTTAMSGFVPRQDPAALRQQLQRFQQCLNQHGVKQPRSSQGRPHRPSKRARRAFQACGHHLPQRPPAFGSGVPGAPPGGFPGAPPGGLPGVPPGAFPGSRSG
jgi:hypothetical protein